MSGNLHHHGKPLRIAAATEINLIFQSTAIPTAKSIVYELSSSTSVYFPERGPLTNRRANTNARGNGKSA